jgi:hypothetical protein
LLKYVSIFSLLGKASTIFTLRQKGVLRFFAEVQIAERQNVEIEIVDIMYLTYIIYVGCVFQKCSTKLSCAFDRKNQVEQNARADIRI